MSNVELTISPVTNQPINITLTPKASKGDPGDSGVYIGAVEPTDPDVNVWVDPSGEESSITASDIPVVDAENNFTANPKNTETVFAEIGEAIEDINQTISGLSAGTAAATSLADTADYYTSNNVEGALAEIGAKTVPLISVTFNANTEYRPTAVDLTDNFFTLAGHGLINNNALYLTLNVGEEWQQYLPNVVCGGIGTAQIVYVVNKTTDTFQISLTSGGAAIDLTSNGGIPNAKWHFEKVVETSTAISGIPNLKKLMLRISGKTLANSQTTKLNFNLLGNITEWMGTLFIGQALTLSFANCSALYRNDVTINTNTLFSVVQDGFSYGVSTAIANTNTTISVKNFCPGRSGLVITSLTLLDHKLANGTILEVFVL
jgi:hypothetical protein